MNVKDLATVLECIADLAEVYIVTSNGKIPLKIEMVKTIWYASNKKEVVEIDTSTTTGPILR